jgi:membrane-associated phospholipid phosphatase
VAASARASREEGPEVALHAVAAGAPVTPAAARTRRLLRRALVVGAPLAYVAALATVILSWGLPLARDQLFFWMLLGLAAFSVGSWRSWGIMLLAWLPWLGLLVVYDELRAAVSVTPAEAHVGAQIAVDKVIGLGAVPTVWLQAHLWRAGRIHWYDYGVWAVYTTHFFAVWLVAAALWRADRRRFARYAAVTVVLTLSAFLVYWLYPAQPPWLASDSARIGPVERIVPLVWDHLGLTSITSVYDNGDLVNTVAAMPSLHAAYPMMLLLFFWDAGPRVRALLGVYVVAMAYALVYSGEHFVSDILAGWAMAGAAYGLVALVSVAWRGVRARRAVGAPA